MEHVMNELGQPVGLPLPEWKAPPRPVPIVMRGTYCELQPLDPATHARQLYEAGQLDVGGRNWTYLLHGPFTTFEDYSAWLGQMAVSPNEVFFAIVDAKSRKAVGVASYLRIDPPNGVIEVGHLNFSPLLQRTPAATEAMFLMMKHAFELGYRRYEWKCHACNFPSRKAAQRLGFSFEGIFRQAIVIKGRTRDTSWYAMIDSEWPALKEAFTRWLSPANFDEAGRQKTSLSELTGPVLKARG